MSQPEKMLEVLNKIKQLGVKLALDDFGTGYSSLSYLRRFPFDKLKIDRSFIIDITNKPEDAAIARAIGEMAHCLNMTVLAEGVETDLQASYMHSCACDQIQGYLISRPLPASEFERLLYPASMIGHTDNLES
jgi:EAL domain-containing protein (putative c-di-GMP-specific phosphodiesterase class I)